MVQILQNQQNHPETMGNPKSDHTPPLTWLLVEDKEDKAAYMMAYITQFRPGDKIIWLYPDDGSVNPYLIGFDLGTDQTYEIKTSIDNGFVEISINFTFLWCHNDEEVNGAFESVMAEKNLILLLDIHYANYHTPDKYIFDGQFKISCLELLSKKSPDVNLIMVATSIQANTALFRQSLNRDERVLIPTDFTYDKGDKMEKDCMEVVLYALNAWKSFYSSQYQYNIDHYLADMAKLDQYDCHNWNNTDIREMHRYLQKKLWNKEWNMPIQLEYLIKLLDYRPKVFFTQINNLQSDRDSRFNATHPLTECLKIMGTKDDKTHNISLLGVLLLAWAAYRHAIPGKKENNYYFVDALNKCTDIQTARYRLIGPPQQDTTLQLTMKAFYDMMFLLFPHQTDNGLDNLKGIKWANDFKCLQFHLGISPKLLHAKLKDDYRNHCFPEDGQTPGGGKTTGKIIKFMSLCNFGDKLIVGKHIIMGSAYGFSIKTAGDFDNNGIILQFGHDT